MTTWPPATIGDVIDQAQLASGGDHCVDGTYGWGTFNSGTITTRVFAVSTVYYRPYVVHHRHAFDRIGIDATSFVAGSTLAFGIYADAGGVPGRRLASTADANAATGANAHVLEITLEAGLYWLAVLVKTSTSTLRCFNGVSVTPFNSIDTTAPTTTSNKMGLKEAATSLPAVATPVAETGTCPIISLRAAYTPPPHVNKMELQLEGLAYGLGDYFRRGYYSHGWYNSGGLSTKSLIVGNAHARPFLVPVRRRFSHLGVNVSTLGSFGAVLRAGLYSMTSGLPDALMADLGTVSSTTTGSKEWMFPGTIILDPGLYWLMLVAQGQSCSVTTYPAATHTAYVADTTTPITLISNKAAYTYNSVTGALPASAGVPASIAGAPAICLKAY